MLDRIRLKVEPRHIGGMIEKALVDAADLTPKMRYSELYSLCMNVPQPMRERYITLLNDVLSGYPHVCFGVPVLMYAMTPTYPGSMLELPLPDHQPPDSGIQRCSWLGLSTLHSEAPFGSQEGPVLLPPFQTTSAVLRFYCQGESAPELNDEWWGDLFRTMPANVCITTGTPMTWPQAVEYAAMMLYAEGTAGDAFPQMFLTDDAFVAASLDGVEFIMKVYEFSRHSLS